MKNTILLSIIMGLFFACSNNDQNNTETQLIGEWKLIEVLADPGDGSGTFQPIKSTKTIGFKNDGTITTNISLCEPYLDEIISSGTYHDNTIITNCENQNSTTVGFKLENEYLILEFVSNEGYSQKFKKVKKVNTNNY